MENTNKNIIIEQSNNWSLISKEKAAKLRQNPNVEVKTEGGKYYYRRKQSTQPTPTRATQPTPQPTPTPAPAPTTPPSYWKRNPGFNEWQIKRFQDILDQEESDYDGPSKNNPETTTNKYGVEKYGEWPNAIEYTNRNGKKAFKYPTTSRWFYLRYRNDKVALLNDIKVRDIRSVGENVGTLNGNDRRVTKGDYGDAIGNLQTILVNRGLLELGRFESSEVDSATYRAIARLMSGNNRASGFDVDEPPTYGEVYNKLKESKGPTQGGTPTGSINPNKPTGGQTSDGTQSKPAQAATPSTPTAQKSAQAPVSKPTKYKESIPEKSTPITYKGCVAALERYAAKGNQKKESGGEYKNTDLGGYTQYEIDKVHIRRCLMSPNNPFSGPFGGEPSKKVSNMISTVQSPAIMTDKFDMITLSESKVKSEKTLIKESLLKFKSKKQDLIIETNIVKNRLSVIPTKGVERSNMSFEKFLSRLMSEMRTLEKTGYSQTALNEGLFDFIGGAFGDNTKTTVIDNFSKRFTKYFLGKMNLTDESQFGQIITKIIDDSVKNGQFVQLMSDCRKMSDMISDSIVKEYVNVKISRPTTGGSPIEMAIKKSIADTLNQTDLSSKISADITPKVCEVLSKIQSKSSELEMNLKNKIVS
jgi:hypothetical protein